jgi:PAS domain S-box-containing protein
MNDRARTRDDTVAEITALKQRIKELEKAEFTWMEEALHLRESYLAAIIEYMPGYVWLKDGESRYLTANPAYVRTVGMQSAAEIAGRTDRDFWPADLADKFRREDLDVMETGKTFAGEESISRDGTVQWFKVFKAPVRDRQGAVIGTAGFARDITAHKQAAEALRRSEEKYRTIFERSIGGICETTPDGRYRGLNQAAADIFGYASPEEMLDAVTDIAKQLYVDPGERQRILARLEREGELKHYEARAIRKDGTIIWVSLNLRAVRDGEGRVLSYEGAVQDITYRKEMEETLRLRESYLTAIVENQPGLVWLKDAEGRYLAANQAFVRHSGRKTVEEIVGKTDSDLWPEGRAEAYRRSDLAVMEAGKPVTTEEPSFRGDRLRWSEKFKAPVRDGQGNTIGTTGYIHDITARKQAAEALRQSEEKYRTILDGIDEAYIEVDLAGKITFLSDPACRITGYSRHELMEQDYHRYTSPETAAMMEAFFKRIYRTGEKSQLSDFELIAKDGSPRRIEMSVNLIRNAEGKATGFRYIARDITARKQAEEELRESRRRLSQIIAFLPDATFAIDLDGKVIFWNRAMEEMSGVKAEDMLGKSDYEYAIPFYGRRRPMLVDLVTSKDQQLDQGHYDTLKRETDLLIGENWLPRFKGTGGYVWGKASPLYDGRSNVIGAIESLRDVTDRKRAEDMLKARGLELEKKSHEQEELNAALRVLLNQRENDKQELEDRITANIRVLVLPQIEKLREKLGGGKYQTHLDTLSETLTEIVSPFVRRLSSRFLNLTNREIQIATLIQEGKVTKEITEILGISEGSVNIHRYSIRKKLNLTKKHNLRAYLSTLDRD